MKTYYSNINKKKLCNRNNGELKTLPRFDFQMQDYFSVTFIDSLNKIIDIDPTDQFYIAGGLDVMKDSENLLFYSEDFTLENNKLTFTIDTYTDNYLNHIKNTNTPIYLEIGILNEKKTILLQDTVLAEPRVYLDGVAPTNIEIYYTKAQIDEKLAAVKVEQTDPIYTADKDTILFKGGLNINGITDENGSITITSDDIVSMYGGDGSYSITEEFRNAEESMWNNVMYELDHNRNYVKTINGLPPDENGNVSVSLGSGTDNKVIESIYPQTEYIEIPVTSLDEIKDRYMVHLNTNYPWIGFPQFENLPGDPYIQWTESMAPCERTFEIWLEDYYNFGLQTIDYGSVQMINPDSVDTTTGGIHVFTVRIAYVPAPGDSTSLFKTVTVSYSYTFMN